MSFHILRVIILTIFVVGVEYQSGSERDYHLNSMVNGRTRINSAVAEIQVRRTDGLHAEIKVWADYAGDRARVDWKSDREKAYTLNLPDKDVLFTSESNMVLKYPKGEIPPRIDRFFDLRNVGFLGSNVIFSAKQYVGLEILKQKENFSFKPYHLTFRVPHPTMPAFDQTTNYKVSPEGGFFPVEVSCSLLRGKEEFVMFAIKSRISQVGDITVPQIVETVYNESGKEVAETWEIRWLSLNEPIDESIFDPENLNHEPSVVFADMRTGSPIVEKVNNGLDQKLLEKGSVGTGALVIRGILICVVVGIVAFAIRHFEKR